MGADVFLAIPSPQPPLPSPPQRLLTASYQPSHPTSPLSQNFFSDNLCKRLELKCRCGWLWCGCVIELRLPAFTHQPPSCATARCTGGREAERAAWRHSTRDQQPSTSYLCLCHHLLCRHFTLPSCPLKNLILLFADCAYPTPWT